MQDIIVRKEALDPEKSFIVQAPAGSGKTELLTNRFLSLLSKVSAPEEILAITFTRKAASEMKLRILEKLRSAIKKSSTDNNDLSSVLAISVLEKDNFFGWNLLKNPSRLEIKTFDAFSSQLVSSLPWLSRMGGIPTISKDIQLHYDAAADSTIRLVGKNNYVRKMLSDLDIDLNLSKYLISDMLKKRDQWLMMLNYGFDRKQLENSLKFSIEEDITRLLKSLPDDWQSKIRLPIRMAAENLYKHNNQNILIPLLGWDQDLRAKICDLPKWKALASLLLTSKKKLRSSKSFNKALGFEPGSFHKEQLLQWIDSLDKRSSWVTNLTIVSYAPDIFFSDNQWDSLIAQLKTLSLSAANLMLNFNDSSEVDFIEITQRASYALGDYGRPDDLLLKLDYKISHILIDEFQDTSYMHFDILRKLISGWQNGDGRTIFMVGDPMQSIYSFRKAEVGLFLHVVNKGIENIKPKLLKLTRNFRSGDTIISWINQAFRSIFPSNNNIVLGAVSYSESVAANKENFDSSVKFHFVDDQCKNYCGAEIVTVNIIEKTFKDNGPNHSIAILVRSRNNIGRLTDLMRKKNIGFNAIDLVPLYKKPVVSDLLQLIKILKNPADRLAWLSILRSPFCGLELKSIYDIFGKDHNSSIPFLLEKSLRVENGLYEDKSKCYAEQILKHSEFIRLSNISILLESYKHVNNIIPSLFIRNIWNNLGGSRVYSDSNAESDANCVFNLIDKLFSYGDIDIKILENNLLNLFASFNKKSEICPVEVMTIHKAKGLEFDTVILYGLQQSAKSDREPLIRFESNSKGILFSPYNQKKDDETNDISGYLKYREKVRSYYEIDRLIYVAVTRAKKNLHFVSSVGIDSSGRILAPSSDSLLSRIYQQINLQDDTLEHVFYRKDYFLQKDSNSVKMLNRVTLEGISKIRSNRKDFFPTDVVNYDLRFHFDDNYSSIVGTVMHFWLNIIGTEGINIWNVVKIRNNLKNIGIHLIRRGIPPKYSNRYAKLIVKALENILMDKKGIWLLSNHKTTRREWSLMGSDGVVSIIDVAVDLGDKWLIVDYKLSQKHKREPYDSFISRIKESYKNQLVRYCDVVSKIDGKRAVAVIYLPIFKTWINVVE